MNVLVVLQSKSFVCKATGRRVWGDALLRPMAQLKYIAPCLRVNYNEGKKELLAYVITYMHTYVVINTVIQEFLDVRERPLT